MDPAIIYAVVSFVVGGLVRHFWPSGTPLTPAVPAGPATPGVPVPGKHPLLDALMSQLDYFLKNPGVAGNPQIEAFLKMLAGLLAPAK